MLIEANVDDLDPRLWPGVLTSLIRAGAADAWLVPIIMKKGRPAHTVSVLARPDQAADLRYLLLALTSTIGVRETRVRKTALPRGWVDLIIAGSCISIKIAHHHGTIWQVTPEFDDLERAADEQDLSPITVLEQAMAAALAAGLVTGAPVPEGLRSSRSAALIGAFSITAVETHPSNARRRYVSQHSRQDAPGIELGLTQPASSRFARQGPHNEDLALRENATRPSPAPERKSMTEPTSSAAAPAPLTPARGHAADPDCAGTAAIRRGHAGSGHGSASGPGHRPAARQQG